MNYWGRLLFGHGASSARSVAGRGKLYGWTKAAQETVTAAGVHLVPYELHEKIFRPGRQVNAGKLLDSLRELHYPGKAHALAGEYAGCGEIFKVFRGDNRLFSTA